MRKRQHTNEFKTKVVLEAINGIETLAALAQRYSLHPGQIQQWKAHAIAELPRVFSAKGASKSADTKEKEELERKVGQLTMENDFLKKNGTVTKRREAAND